MRRALFRNAVRPNLILRSGARAFGRASEATGVVDEALPNVETKSDFRYRQNYLCEMMCHQTGKGCCLKRCSP